MTTRFRVRPWFRISSVLLLLVLTIAMWAVSWGPFSDHSQYSRSLRGLLTLAPLMFVLGAGTTLWLILQLRSSELVITDDEITIPVSSSSRTQKVAIADVDSVIVKTDKRAGRVVDLHLRNGRRARVFVNMVHDSEGLIAALTGIDGVEATVLDDPRTGL